MARPVRDFAVEQMMALIRADLAALGVHHDLFVSERELDRERRDRRMLSPRSSRRGLIYTGCTGTAEGQAAG